LNYSWRIRLSGLAIIAGFAVTVYLASDFSIEPLTAARKIVLLGSLSALLALVAHIITIALDWLAASCARERSRDLDDAAHTSASGAPGCGAVGRGLRGLCRDPGLEHGCVI